MDQPKLCDVCSAPILRYDEGERLRNLGTTYSFDAHRSCLRIAFPHAPIFNRSPAPPDKSVLKAIVRTIREVWEA